MSSPLPSHSSSRVHVPFLITELQVVYFHQVHALSRWIEETLDRQDLAGERGNLIVGLLLETGVPYVLAALSCLHAG